MLNLLVGIIIGCVLMFFIAAWAISYAVGSPKFWQDFFKDLGG